MIGTQWSRPQIRRSPGSKSLATAAETATSAAATRTSTSRTLLYRRKAPFCHTQPVCEHVFVSDEGTILHADLDSFYASVEQRDDPKLRGRPVIVGAGVVLAASYEAKAFGVRTAMGGRQARRLCPHAIVVPPRMSAYSEASKDVYRVFEDTTPARRGALDRRGVPRRARDGAARRHAQRDRRRGCRRAVRERVGLPITVGVARTKFLAKVASARGEAGRPARRPAARRARVPASAAGRAALGRRAGDGREAARARDRDRRPGRLARGGRARRACWDAPPAATCSRSRTTAIPRRVRVGRRRGSIGSQSRTGGARRESSTRCSSAWSTV